jgi:cytochrome P450
MNEMPPGDGDVMLRGFAEVRGALSHRDMAQALHVEWDDDSVLTDTVLQLHGPGHRLRRTVENVVFTRERFDRYELDLLPVVYDALVPHLAPDGRADLPTMGKALTIWLASVTVGLDIEPDDLATLGRLAGFVDLINRGLSLTFTTRDREELKAEVRTALEPFATEFVLPAFARRRAAVADGTAVEGADVLTEIARRQDELAIGDDVVVREAGIYLEGGSFTSTLTLMHTVHHLLELEDTRPGSLDRHRDDPVAVQRAVLEALRLHPIMSVSKRRAEAPVEVGDHTFDAGTVVVLDNDAANRDPEAFGATADEFDPDREPAAGVPRHGVGFGGGPHACIGRVLAVGTPPPAPGEHPKATHRLGLVPRLVGLLLADGVRRDPDRSPEMEADVIRRRYETYPVILTARTAATVQP